MGVIVKAPEELIDLLGAIGLRMEKEPVPVEKHLDALRDELNPEIKKQLDEIQQSLDDIVGKALSRAVVTLIAAFLALVNKINEPLGVALGAMNVFQQMGEVGENMKQRPAALDMVTLAQVAFRLHNHDINKLDKELARIGMSRDRAALFMEAVRPLVSSSETLKLFALGQAKEQTIKDLEQLGYDTKDAERMLKLVRTLLSPTDAIAWWLRNDKENFDIDKYLSLLSYDKEDIKIIKELANVIPSIQDLIRMAVREVFSPDQRKLLDLDSEFPEDVKKWAAKQGLSEEWAKNYWAAHWELPSLTEAFEMFHRTTTANTDSTAPSEGTAKGQSYHRVISEETLKALIKAQDISPIWRNRLIEISFNPLTRVDVRRMYGLGVIDKDEVYRAYLDLGYTAENAKRLTDFVVADDIESSVGVIKARMFTLFRRKLVSEAQFRQFLKSLGFPDAKIEIIVQQEIMLRNVDFLELRLRAIQQQYMNHIIDEKLLVTRLISLGIEPEAVESYATLWIDARLAKVARIGMPDLKKAFKKGIISKERFLKELEERGFPADDRDIMEALFAPEPTPEPPPEGPPEEELSLLSNLSSGTTSALSEAELSNLLTTTTETSTPTISQLPGLLGPSEVSPAELPSLGEGGSEEEEA